MLTKHEGVHFTETVVQTAGQAYIDCRFERVTLVVQNPATTVFDGCRFHDCAWHLSVSLDELAACDALLAFVVTLRGTVPRTRRPRPGLRPAVAGTFAQAAMAGEC